MAESQPTASPPPLPHVAAALAVAASSFSIAALGRHLADVDRAYDAHDPARLLSAMPEGAQVSEGEIKTLCNEAREILNARSEALRAMIATLPAQTLADAAVQVAEIGRLASLLWGFDLPREEIEGAAAKVERMAYGIMPVLAAAAGLTMAEMDWADADALRVSRFAAVGVLS